MRSSAWWRWALRTVPWWARGLDRCVANGRMERFGMRWVLDGIYAMLGLRSISLSGLWEEFMAFRIAQESQRPYPDRAANDPDMSFPCAGLTGAGGGLHPAPYLLCLNPSSDLDPKPSPRRPGPPRSHEGAS
jgi:hypothetical protein